MGTLIRLIMSWFGKVIPLPEYLCSVSKTFQMLPGSKKRKWIWGGLLHLIPVIVGLLTLFYFRQGQLTHSMTEINALWLAGTWAWVGPSLIWYYERYTVPIFYKHCRRLIKNDSLRCSVRKLVYSNIFSMPICRAISILWVSIVFIGYLLAIEFVKGFGISGYDDWLWWILSMGVLLYGYYSSIGFCYIYKTILLTKKVNVSGLENRVYHRDGVFGFSFIGNFALNTSMMFLSGIFIVPLVLLIGNHGQIYEYIVALTLIGLYVLIIAFAFCYPIMIIRKKLILEKENLSQSYCAVANQLIGKLNGDFTNTNYCRYSFYRKLITDLHAVGEWPLKLDVTIKFLSISIIFPFFVGILVFKLTTP